MAETEDFATFAASRLHRLRQAAFALCGDWQLADDLAAIVLGKAYRKWRQLSRAANIDGYLHRMLLRTRIDELRRPWRREHPTDVPASDPVDPSDQPDLVCDRLVVRSLLAELPPRRRAVLLLRFWHDLTVEQVAQRLECSTGTVKSQTARALDTLRTRLPAIADIPR